MLCNIIKRLLKMSEKTQLTTFNKIIEVVLQHEGGYVNDPNDLGGETKYGITKRFYPDVDIKNLTKEQAKTIYHTDYWRRGRCDEVPSYLRHIYFDMCVNFGQGGAVKVLQRTANGKNKEKIEKFTFSDRGKRMISAENSFSQIINPLKNTWFLLEIHKKSAGGGTFGGEWWEFSDLQVGVSPTWTSSGRHCSAPLPLPRKRSFQGMRPKTVTF